MSKIAVKLAFFSDFVNKREAKAKYVVASGVQELSSKGLWHLFFIFCVSIFSNEILFLGAIAHGLNVGDCEIVTGCGTVILDDEVLFLLYKKEPFYVKSNQDQGAASATQPMVITQLNTEWI